MAENEELFKSTFMNMTPGESLLVAGGTFPAQSESAEIEVNLARIMPMDTVFGTGSRGVSRINELANPSEDTAARLLLERNDKRFGTEADGPDISYGKGIGQILGITIDMVIVEPLGPQPYYFVTRPSDIS